MNPSIPDHRLDTAIGNSLPLNTYFHRQLRSLGVSRQRHTLDGLRGGGAAEHWLQYRDLHYYDAGGRWTSERVLERCIQEGAFLPYQNQLSKEVANRLSALAEPAPNSHHVATERVEEFTPFNGAVPTPSRASRCVTFVTWCENKEQADDAHDTGTDALGWIMSSRAYGGRAFGLLFIHHPDSFLCQLKTCKILH